MAGRDAQRVERFRKAFEALPEGPREVFWAHTVERLGYRAIAQRLGIDIPAVEAQLAEAILQIDRALGEGDRPGSG